MDASGEGAVFKAVQELLALRESVDQRLAECLDRLQGVCNGGGAAVALEGTSQLTTPRELPHKRPRETAESSDASVKPTNDLPCRVDLSHWTQLLSQEFLSQHREIESRTGKKFKPSYVYGNYPNYYRYRLADPNTNDPRIPLLLRRWFEGKDCLDVGSHIGVLPLGIVTSYAPKTMTGIEIDSALFERANNLHTQLMQKYKEDHRMTVHAHLKQTHFIQGDALEVPLLEGSFDVVTCLSVSKWIHFHHGDSGMQKLFLKFWTVLRDGGMLIFEPQPLRSYSQAERKQDMSGVPFPAASIEFLPDQFLEYLTEVVGFRCVDTLQQPDATSQGFERPIYVLRKSFAQREPHWMAD